MMVVGKLGAHSLLGAGFHSIRVQQHHSVTRGCLVGGQEGLLRSSSSLQTAASYAWITISLHVAPTGGNGNSHCISIYDAT